VSTVESKLYVEAATLVKGEFYWLEVDVYALPSKLAGIYIYYHHLCTIVTATTTAATIATTALIAITGSKHRSAVQCGLCVLNRHTHYKAVVMPPLLTAYYMLHCEVDTDSCVFCWCIMHTDMSSTDHDQEQQGTHESCRSGLIQHVQHLLR
jgi:hypothetical protein